MLVLGDMRHHVSLTAVGDKVPRVVALVRAECNATVARQCLIEHLQSDLAFGAAVGLADTQIHQQTVAVLHENVLWSGAGSIMSMSKNQRNSRL